MVSTPVTNPCPPCAWRNKRGFSSRGLVVWTAVFQAASAGSIPAGSTFLHLRDSLLGGGMMRMPNGRFA